MEIDNSYEDYMFGSIKRICDEIGPRESGSREEKMAADEIEAELSNYCDSTYQEDFTCHPTAFLGFIRYSVILGIAGLICYWLSLTPPAGIPAEALSAGCLVLVTAAVILFWREFLRYDEFIDLLFPEKSSSNVIGVIEPTEDVKSTVIFSAHHDSAYEFNLWYWFKSFGAIIIMIGVISLLALWVLSGLRTINYWYPFMPDWLFLYSGWIFAFLSPFIAAIGFFHSYRAVEGAFDNLSGVSVVLGIAKYLSENPPEHTRVKLISFGCEEAGLRGSKRYVRRHEEELQDKTVCVNMDGIGKNNIKIITHEVTIQAEHSPEVYTGLMRAAAIKGISAQYWKLPFGASDAATFSLKGYRAASMVTIPDHYRLPEFYHTRLDRLDVVEKDSLEKVLRICLGYLQAMESSADDEPVELP